MNISVEIEGKKQFNSQLDRFTSACDRPFANHELVKKIQSEFFKYMKGAFRSEGASTGRKWAPLSKKYKKWKSKHYPGKTILRRTDRLKKSLTSKGGEHWQIVGGKLVGQTLELGSEVPYAVYHDSTGARKSNLPRRPILRLNDRFIEKIHRLIHKHIWQEFKKGRTGL